MTTLKQQYPMTGVGRPRTSARGSSGKELALLRFSSCIGTQNVRVTILSTINRRYSFSSGDVDAGFLGGRDPSDPQQAGKTNGSPEGKPLICWLRGQDLNL
jgi:hypothetical protein